MLDKMFDFEKIIAEQTKMSAEKFMKSGDYLYLRSGIIERWDTLNEFYTYLDSDFLGKIKVIYTKI